MKKDIKRTKEKIIEALEGKKEYQVIYKFSDVIDTIVAKSQEEAEQIADERLSDGKFPPRDETSCYEVEVEEIK